jgi:hypothetical protein
MPTEITGQNGAVIKDTTTIATPGCVPTLDVTKVRIKGNAVVLTIKLDEAGTVKITGRGLKGTTKKNLGAGVHTVTIHLTATGRIAKRHHHKITVHLAELAGGLTGTATAVVKG